MSYISQLKVIEDPRSFWLKVLSERGDPIPLHHKLIDQFIINWMHVTGPVFSIPLAPCMIFYNSTPSVYLFLLGACSEKLHKNNVFQILHQPANVCFGNIMICCMDFTDCIFSCELSKTDDDKEVYLNRFR